MKTVKTIAEITQLPLGTELYQPTATDLQYWYYGGVNPKSSSGNLIMLINSGSIKDVQCVHLSDNKFTYFLNYDEARQEVFELAKKNVEIVKSHFVD